MARASREQSEATATRVLAAAASLFARRGYADVGLEEVAARAGVTRGAVYHHYGSKSGLFSAVHAEAQRRVAQAVDRDTASYGDPWEALEVGCRTFLEASVRDDVRRVLLVDAPAVLGWSAWREQDARNSGQLLMDVLVALADRGAIAVPSIGATHALLSGAMNEAALWVAASDRPAEALDEARASLTQLLGALRRK